MESICPLCNHKFDMPAGINGRCQSCNTEYEWDELYIEETSDCWISIYWKELKEYR